MNPKVFIVILNWNQAQLTLECIESVKKLNAKNCELRVLVVDNNSSTPFPLSKDYDLITNSANLGFAQGNNIGIKYAMENNADYLVLINNDTIVDKKLIKNVIDVMEEDKEIGAISPKIYFASGFEFHKDRYKKNELGKVIWYAGGKMDWDNIYGSNRGVDEVDKGQYNFSEETDFATGCCMVLRAQTLKEIGLFDEKYFMYLEDVDLSMRIKKKGWKVIYDSSGVVWHKVAQSSGIGSGLNDYFLTRNRMYFGMKYASLRARFALMRESFKFLISGRIWQRQGVLDYYLDRLGRGSWK